MSNHRTITVGAGEWKLIRVNSGETFENVLIDQRAPRAGATIIAKGTNWTIRNVGFLGKMGQDQFCVAPADTGGGTSTVENVYIGDGSENIGARRDPAMGMWVDPAHNGTLNIRRCYVEGAHDNAFYASAPGSNSNGQRGVVNFTNCYAKNNWVSCFRLARGTVRNCTGINTSVGRDGRPLWVWNTDLHPGRVEVYNCNFIAGGYPYSVVLGQQGKSTEVYFENVQFDRGTHARVSESGSVNLIDGGGNGSNPQDVVPSGCPQDAITAAEGNWDGGSPPSEPDDPDGGDDEEPEPEPEPDPEDPDDGDWNEPDEPQIEWPEYEQESIVVDVDEHRTIDVSGGQRYGGVIIDVTREGAGATIVARGDQWFIGAVAFTGQNNADASINVATPRGGRSTIENVYLGDGGSGGIVTADRHRGTVNVNDTHLSGHTTGVDASNGDGEVHVNRLYASSCETAVALSQPGDDISHSHFLCGTDDFAVTVDGVDDPAEVYIQNCDFTYNGEQDNWDMFHSADGGTATIDNCRFTDGFEPDSSDWEIVNADPNTPSTALPTGVSADANDVFGRSSVWRRPERRQILLTDVMITGAEEYGLRVGSADPRVRTLVENCVIDVDGVGLIADTGTVTVRNCDIRGEEANRRTANGGEIESFDTRWGDDAVIEPPTDNLPTSSEEASGFQR